MFILSKQFSDKCNKLYTKSMNDSKIDNDEYKELVQIYEEYNKDKKSKLIVFFYTKVFRFSYNNIFINSNISINI